MFFAPLGRGRSNAVCDWAPADENGTAPESRTQSAERVKEPHKYGEGEKTVATPTRIKALAGRKSEIRSKLFQPSFDFMHSVQIWTFVLVGVGEFEMLSENLSRTTAIQNKMDQTSTGKFFLCLHCNNYVWFFFVIHGIKAKRLTFFLQTVMRASSLFVLF